MKRNLFLLLAILLVALSVSFAAVLASAQDKVVFVNQTTGNDANDGTSQGSAVRTLNAAFKKLSADGGTIVLTSDYTLSTDYTTPKYEKQVTVTSVYNGTDYHGKLKITGSCLFTLNGDTVFRDVTVYQSSALTFVANFHSVLFDDGFAVTGSKNTSVVGGYWSPMDKTLNNTLDSHITVNSGDFYYLLGFSRKIGAGTQEYTGTSHITVNGGNITKIFGGSSENHYGGSTKIEINGGKIGEIHTAGDVTRRLKGNAEVTINGGEITTLDINNVMGEVDLNIVGSAPSSVAVTYYNDTLRKDAEKIAAQKKVVYNSLACSPALIATFSKYFDVIENSTVVFVAAGGSGDGSSLDKPLGSFGEAYAKLKIDGGKMFVVGEVPYDVAAADGYIGTIDIEGYGSGAALIFASGAEAVINTDTVFDNLQFKAADSATLYAGFNKLTIDRGVTTSGNVSIVGSTQNKGEGDVFVTVNGGKYSSVVGVGSTCADYTGDVTVILGDSVTEHASLSAVASARIKNATLSVSGGEHKDLVACDAGRVTDALIINILGGKCTAVKINGADKNVIFNISHAELGSAVAVEGLGSDKSTRTFVLGTGVDESKLEAVKSSFSDPIQGNIVYVKTGADGHGRSPDSPVGNLNTAIKLLGARGKIVVCGEYDITKGEYIEEHAYPITVTNVGIGVDYRDTGASVNFNASLFLGGETMLENIDLTCAGSGLYLCAMSNKLTIGENVETELVSGNTAYINIVGGRNDTLHKSSVDVTINSGDWGVVRAGANDTSLFQEGVSIRLTVNGGTFHRYVTLASRGAVTKSNIHLTVNGGTFYQSIYGVYEEDGRYYKADYDIVFDLNGGKFYQMIAPACSFSTKLSGTFTVNLNGGDYAHLTDLFGSTIFEGNMTSEINSNVDLDELVTGTDTFTNPVRASGPDPWVFFYDGSYYYTHTTGSKIVLMKVSNFSDIDTSAERGIITPTEGQNMWSPEIHYFSAEEVGEENAGWYLYIGYDDGTTANQRQHVLKCLDGDNLLGRWGDPVTGKLNQPRKVEVPNAPHYNNDELCGGSSKIVINGKTYMTFISEVGRGTSNFHQTVNITEIENPWTYKSVPTTICVPEYQWEMGGYGQASATGLWYPKVVEGASAVYSDSGDVYLMYTGSGYWTKYYALGYLKFLGGDPMDASNWKKMTKEPILSLSSEVNGCGHGSYFKDHEGNYYVAYHGYLGATADGGRYAHIERIYVTSKGITIGNGSGHPAPLSSVYTISLNPRPLGEKISAFGVKQDDAPVQQEPTPDTTPAEPEKAAGLEPAAIIAIAVMAVVVVVGAAVVIVMTKKPVAKAETKGKDPENTDEEQK